MTVNNFTIATVLVAAYCAHSRDGVLVEEGHIFMPELPGIGFEGKPDLIGVIRALAE